MHYEVVSFSLVKIQDLLYLFVHVLLCTKIFINNQLDTHNKVRGSV